MAETHFPDKDNQLQLSDGSALPPFSVTLDNLLLTVISAYRTPSKLTASVTVTRKGKRIDTITVSTAWAVRQAAAKILARHLGCADLGEVEKALGLVIVQAEEMALLPKNPTGCTIRTIVTAKVPPKIDFAFRCGRRAWSNRLREKVTASAFTGYGTAWCIEACEKASD